MICRGLLRSAAIAGILSEVAFAPAAAAAPKLEDSGASFPFPIYSAWFKQFSRDKAIGNSTAPARTSSTSPKAVARAF